MTSRIPENSSTWLVDWSPVTINEDDENQSDEPAVVREPDDE